MKIQIKPMAAWVVAISAAMGMAALSSQAADTGPTKAKAQAETKTAGQAAPDAAKDAKNFCGSVGKEYVCIP